MKRLVLRVLLIMQTKRRSKLQAIRDPSKAAFANDQSTTPLLVKSLEPSMKELLLPLHNNNNNNNNHGTQHRKTPDGGRINGDHLQ